MYTVQQLRETLSEPWPRYRDPDLHVQLKSHQPVPRSEITLTQEILEPQWLASSQTVRMRISDSTFLKSVCSYATGLAGSL